MIEYLLWIAQTALWFGAGVFVYGGTLALVTYALWQYAKHH